MALYTKPSESLVFVPAVVEVVFKLFLELPVGFKVGFKVLDVAGVVALVVAEAFLVAVALEVFAIFDVLLLRTGAGGAVPVVPLARVLVGVVPEGDGVDGRAERGAAVLNTDGEIEEEVMLTLVMAEFTRLGLIEDMGCISSISNAERALNGKGALLEGTPALGTTSLLKDFQSL